MNLAFVELFWELMNRKTGLLGRIEYQPQKPAFRPELPGQQPLERSVPEKQGVSSSYLAELISELATAPGVSIHQIMIARHGKVIYEGAFDPWLPGCWHATYSMCKSFTGMAIGLLVDDGVLSLDTPVLEVFKTHASLQGVIQKIRYSSLTVRNLLDMSSGVSFNEMGAITGNDWVKLFLESGAKFEPGTRFEYNSMNSFILSAIVTQLTGKTMLDFLQERIFDPLGISNVFWESSPRGITKGGWGMFLRPEDAVKLGLLYLQKGRWNDIQVLSEDWVEDSVSPQIETGLDYAPYYGYHCWIGHLPGSFIFNGMLGQNVYVFPSLDMVICVNAGNKELFSNGNMNAIFRRYFSDSYIPSSVPLPDNTSAYQHLMEVRRTFGPAEGLEDILYNGQFEQASQSEPDRTIEKTFRTARTIRHGGWSQLRRGRSAEQSVQASSLLRRISGRVYEMTSKNVGLFPLIMQVVHNNYTRGISMLRFRVENGTLYIDIKEGSILHRLPVGFGKARHTSIQENGEEYLVGILGRLALNEDDIPVLTLRIALLEEAMERRLKISFLSDDEIELRWSETPGSTIIGDGFQMVASGKGGTNRIFSGVLSQISPDLTSEIMHSLACPFVKAKWNQEADIEACAEEALSENVSASDSDMPAADADERPVCGTDMSAADADAPSAGSAGEPVPAARTIDEIPVSRTDSEMPEASINEQPVPETDSEEYWLDD